MALGSWCLAHGYRLVAKGSRLHAPRLVAKGAWLVAKKFFWRRVINNEPSGMHQTSSILTLWARWLVSGRWYAVVGRW